MPGETPLERRLRESRYQKGVDSCIRVLESIGVVEGRRRVLGVDEVDELWPRFLSHLRDDGSFREKWPAEQIADVRRHVAAVRDMTAGLTVVWFALQGSEPVGIEASADELLEAGLSYLVSPAGDLMLTTTDVSSGFCVERNHTAEGDEYEIVEWGVFHSSKSD